MRSSMLEADRRRARQVFAAAMWWRAWRKARKIVPGDAGYLDVSSQIRGQGCQGELLGAAGRHGQVAERPGESRRARHLLR